MHGNAALAGMFLLFTSAPFTPFSSPVKPHRLRPSLQALRNEGRNLFETREYARAEQVFREGLREALRLNDQSAAASFLNSSGGAQFALFHYRRALQSFREAHRLALRTGDGELVVMSSLNLSTLYLQQNDLNSALRAAEDGIRLLRRYAAAKKGPLLKAQAGVLYARAGQFDLALQLLGESAQDADSRGDSETRRQVLNQIGYEYLTAGDSQSAEGPLVEAFRLCKLSGCPDLMYSYYALGMLRLAQKHPDPASACVLLDRAVALSANSPMTLPVWRFYFERGRARLANGQLAEALPDLEKSMESATRLRAELLSADSVWTGVGTEQHNVFAAYIRARAALYFRTGDPAHARHAFQALAETQASGLRALVHRSAEWRDRLPAEYWETLAQLRAVEASLLAKATPAAEKASSALLYKLTSMEAEAGPDSAESGDPSDGTAGLSRRVQEALGKDAAFICFHLDEPASFRWAVTREAFELQRLPSGRQLSDAARQFERAVSNEDPEAVSLGTELYQDLFGSLPAGVHSRRDWILALDGQLLDAPFAALVIRQHGRQAGLSGRSAFHSGSALCPDAARAGPPQLERSVCRCRGPDLQHGGSSLAQWDIPIPPGGV